MQFKTTPPPPPPSSHPHLPPPPPFLLFTLSPFLLPALIHRLHLKCPLILLLLSQPLHLANLSFSCFFRNPRHEPLFSPLLSLRFNPSPHSSSCCMLCKNDVNFKRLSVHTNGVKDASQCKRRKLQTFCTCVDAQDRIKTHVHCFL